MRWKSHIKIKQTEYMGALLSYSLTASVIIIVLFPVLYRVVNRSTSFRFNRFAIICGLTLSLVLPFVFSGDFMGFLSHEAVTGEGAPADIVAVVTDVAMTGQNLEQTTGFPWVAVMVVAYFSGVMILFCCEMISFARLFRIVAGSEKAQKDGVTICRIADNNIAPFSWGNFIFIHDSELENGAGTVYLHEKAHTERRHWIDVLLADMFCIMLWYNPFAWMTKRLMKLNHEFEADSAVISAGIDNTIINAC